MFEILHLSSRTSTSIWRHCATPSFSSYIQDLNACPHRQHRILVNLQMLNLSYNRLSSVTFLQPHNFLTTGGSSSQSRNSGSLENTYGSVCKIEFYFLFILDIVLCIVIISMIFLSFIFPGFKYFIKRSLTFSPLPY